jgi:hypothetical protein
MLARSWRRHLESALAWQAPPTHHSIAMQLIEAVLPAALRSRVDRPVLLRERFYALSD